MKEKTILVAGTFDILHESHINFLRNSRNLGDNLIVMLSTDEFNEKEKNKSAYQSYMTRKYVLEAVRYVDLVVPEISWNDKEKYIDMFDVDIFAMGADWTGKFDYLTDKFPNLKIMYFPRGATSSTKIKQDLMKSKEMK